MSKQFVTTTPLPERIASAKAPEDLLALMSEIGMMTDLAMSHRFADDVLAKLVKILAIGRDDAKVVTEVARRWGTLDKRYYAPD